MALLNSINDMLSLGNYLRQHHYNDAFIDDPILSMTGAYGQGLRNNMDQHSHESRQLFILLTAKNMRECGCNAGLFFMACMGIFWLQQWQ
ncbi:MAG: hypothetical protein ACXW04_02830 [Methylobacter sp.]